jgi:hypothetical protein
VSQLRPVLLIALGGAAVIGVSYDSRLTIAKRSLVVEKVVPSVIRVKKLAII